MIQVAASDFEIVNSRDQIPFEAIVFVLALVGVFNDSENLALAVYLLDQYSDGSLLAVVFFLFFGERVLLACLEGQHRVCGELVDAQKT